MRDPGQNQRRLDLNRNSVNSIFRGLRRKELEEKLLQYQVQGTGSEYKHRRVVH